MASPEYGAESRWDSAPERQRLKFVPRAIASREFSRCIVAKESQWTLSVNLCQAQINSLDGLQEIFPYSRRDASLVGGR
jgi:hypothetical protein